MVFLDLTTFRCPVPLVQVKQALKRLPDGEILEVVLFDSGSRRDVPAFLKKIGYEILTIQEDAQCLRFRICQNAAATYE